MSDYKDVYNNAYYEFLEEGYSEQEAIKLAKEAMENFLGANEYATGGRIGFDDGGYAAYLQAIQDARADLPSESISVTEGSPYYEALVGSFAEDLATAGNTAVPQEKLVPEVAEQNKIQQG